MVRPHYKKGHGWQQEVVIQSSISFLENATDHTLSNKTKLKWQIFKIEKIYWELIQKKLNSFGLPSQRQLLTFLLFLIQSEIKFVFINNKSQQQMQEIIHKEIEFSDRKQALNGHSDIDKEVDHKNIGPCSFRDLFSFSDNLDKILMFFGSIFSITNGVSLIFYATPLGDLINAFNPAADMDNLITNIGKAAYGFFLNGLLVFFSCCLMTVSWTISSQRQLVRIRKLYYETLLKQELQWFDKNRPEQVCSDMYVQTQRAQNTLVESITSMLTCLSMGISSIIVSFVKGWKLAIVLNSYIPIIVILNYLRSQINLKSKVITADMSTKMNGDVFEVFENIKTVKYLGGEEYELDRYSKDLQQYRKISIKMQKKMALIWSITAFCSTASVFALGFWYGCKLIADETFNDNTGANYTIGDVISIFFCMYISTANFNPLSGHFANLNGCRIAFNKIIHMIRRKPKKSQGFQQCLGRIDQIQFKNITFQFSQPLFYNFNLTLRKGIIALIGSSGNGKSTLLNLLVKFYEPISGSIILSNELEEQKLVDVEENSLRSRIGYVGQEPVLLGRTFRQVLLAEDLKEQRIWEVLDICCISEMIKDLGLDSPYKAVSGGQKQRLAIARAILRNPQILILDEGTSALDSINEKNVLKNIRQRSKISFVIMIAHRLQTLAEADQIFKIKKGEVQKIQLNALDKEIQEIQEDQQIDQSAEQASAPINQLGTQQFQEKSSIKNLDNTSKSSSDKVKEPEKSKFKWAYFKRLLQINKRYKYHYIVGIISAAFLGAIFPSLSVVITKLISVTTKIAWAKSQTEKQEIVSESHTISIVLFVVAFLNLFMIVFKEFSFIEIGQNLLAVLKKAAFKTAINMQMKEIDKRGKNHLVHTINNSSESAKNLVSLTISSFVDVAATLIIGISMALAFCWQITIVAFLLIPLCAIAGMIQNKFLTQLGENSDKILRKTHQMVLQSIVNNRTVASLNLQNRYTYTYGIEQDNGLKIVSKNAVFSGITQGVSQMLIAFVICLICYVGALLAENFNVSIAGIFSAIYAVMFSGVQAGTNIQFIGGISSSILRTTQYFQIVNQDNKELEQEFKISSVSTYSRLHQQLDEISSEKMEKSQASQGLVQFKNVYFRYPQKKDYIFEGLNFTVKPNERIAIVGQSGTGKTTIADLLLNIYHPEQGQILIDKVSTVNYAKKQIESRFAIVSQEAALFNRSIYENIKYNMKYSLKDVKQAAKIADAQSFIEEGNFGSGYSSKDQKNQNWDKLVGSKGSLLSGGQKQRVALARAVIRKPVLMIMDEATSALDRETEERVLENIYKLNCTQVVIAHRLSTIKSCDRIIVLKDGRLFQTGTYEELLNLNGEFAKLAKRKRQK